MVLLSAALVSYGDYCERHKPAPRPGAWDDSVRGFVVGGDALTHYKFFRDGRFIHGGNYADDHDAIADFRAQFQEDYALGCEMRVYDQ